MTTRMTPAQKQRYKDWDKQSREERTAVSDWLAERGIPLSRNVLHLTHHQLDLREARVAMAREALGYNA